MNNPFFSVIIASFNARSLLVNTLESLREQTFENYELIVIDGGSKDGTVDLLELYGAPITKWISEPDTGIYDAWNKGVGLARGSWISFIGAGDTYLPHSLQEYANYLKQNLILDYVSSRVELFDHNGRCRSIGQPWSWKRFRRFMCVAHVGSMHSRILFTNHGVFDKKYRICGDYEFLLRPGAGLHAGFLDLNTARMKAGGISGTGVGPLKESLYAKIESNSVKKHVAYFDFVFAVVKLYVRQWARRI